MKMRNLVELDALSQLEEYRRTHEKLFRVVANVYATSSSTLVTPICQPRLEEAIKLVGKIDEVSCGLWRINFYGAGSGRVVKHAVLEVDLSPKFLHSVGIPVDKDFILDGRRAKTSMLIKLGCPECAKIFAKYAMWRWHDELIEDRVGW